MLGVSILVINPGSTGTKVALYQGEEELWTEAISCQQLPRRGGYVEQEFPRRLKQVRRLLEERRVRELSAIVGRGGLLRPVPGGVYRVNETMYQDALQAKRGEHASNLGCLLARELAADYGVPAFVVDPVSTDEFEPMARVSGLPELPRQSLAHYLSIKSVYRQICQELGLTTANAVIAHLGSGISVAAVRGGRVIDTNNANDEGPFSPERAGGLPVGDLVRICYSGRVGKDELKAALVSGSGLQGYLGTADAREVEKRIEAGEEVAKLVFSALAYQIGKEIGAMASVLAGQVSAIGLSGGLAYSKRLVEALKKQVGFIAPVLVYPGEKEMEALARGVLRVLRGEEQAKRYPEGDEVK